MVNAFSTLAIFTAGLAGVVSAAYTVADTSVDPSGNPIFTPETDGTVVAGKPFEVTWNATSAGTVTIYLCIGPEINCVNEAVPFADKIANKGTFTWNVPTTLAPSKKKGTGYGIQLVSDQNNKVYQWSGQFGIDNPGYTGGSASGSPTKGPTTPYPTATGGANSTYIQPTKSMSVPSSLKPTSATAAGTSQSSTPTSQPTGAAGSVQIGMGALVGGVLAALAL